MLEYADGIPLSEVRTASDRIYDIFCELCDALSALHNAGVIHRDIKPSNIILCSDGHIRLIDFDAARVKKPAADKDTSFVGTDGFAPPEQFGFAQTDERSDIYAMGVTMQLLLGEGYHRSRYRRVIERCTRFNPEQRYASAVQVRRALGWCRYGGAAVIGAAAAGAVICIIAAVSLLSRADVPYVQDIPDISDISVSVSDAAETTTTAATTTTTAATTTTTAATTTTTAATTTTTAATTTTTAASTAATAVTTAATTAVTTPISAEPEPVQKPYVYSWETLLLPKDFPRLADGISEYTISQGYLEMYIGNVSRNTAKEMAEQLAEWTGGSSEYGELGTSVWWNISGGIVYDDLSLSCTFVPEENSSYVRITGYSSDPLADVELVYCGISEEDVSLSDTGDRSLSWEELTLPEGMPKLADGVTYFLDQSALPDEGEEMYYDYMLEWELSDISEACVMMSKLHALVKSGYSANYYDGCACWYYSNEEYYVLCNYYTEDAAEGTEQLRLYMIVF